LERWQEIAKFKHDGLPIPVFKYGVIAFADGEQTANEFYIHAEALKGMDEKFFICNITPE